MEGLWKHLNIWVWGRPTQPPRSTLIFRQIGRNSLLFVICTGFSRFGMFPGTPEIIRYRFLNIRWPLNLHNHRKHGHLTFSEILLIIEILWNYQNSRKALCVVGEVAQQGFFSLKKAPHYWKTFFVPQETRKGPQHHENEKTRAEKWSRSVWSNLEILNVESISWNTWNVNLVFCN